MTVFEERQQQVFEFIRTYHAEHGIAPSTREIANGAGIRSKATVDRALDALVERGVIGRHDGKARGIYLKDKA